MLQTLLYLAHQIAVAHDRWRSSAAPRRPMLVELSVLRERVDRLRAENDLLRVRLRRVHPRRRPHYRAFERLAILWHAARYGMSVEATARAFVVSFTTVVNWRRDVAAKAPRLVQGKPPVNKLPDLVADLAHRLKREGPRWGNRRIAGVLARLGLKVSKSSVQLFLRRPRPRPAAAERVVAHRRSSLVAKHPGHIWFIDFTRVGGLFRSVVVGAVIDGFSRRVLSLAVAPHEPSAAFAVRLVREAVREFGAPTWLVSDHGTQLTAADFVRFLRRRGIGHRYGAVHRHGSIAIIERWWKTMHVEYASGISLYRPLRSIESRLQSFVRWYNEARPHQGLGQRTPDEVYFARSTRAHSVPLRAVLHVEHLDGERELPVLRLRPAA